MACAPQSWAAAAVFLLVQSTLGLRVDGLNRRITFHYPVLPEFLEQIHIANLRVCDAKVDLRLQRHPTDVGVTVLKREGEVEIVVVR